MNTVDFFPVEKDFIIVHGVVPIVQFSRYKPKYPEIFLEGLELGEDLKTGTGMVLYTKGTRISPEVVARLIQFRKDNPDLDFIFKIKRSQKLIQSFSKEITSNMIRIFKRNQSIKEYRELFKGVNINIEDFIQDLLSEEKVALTVYYLYFLCESSTAKRSLLFFDHSINVVLFCLAMASSVRYSNVFQGNRAKLIDLAKVGLFHNFGSLSQMERVLDFPQEEQSRRYWEANHKGYFTLGSIDIGFDILDAIRLLCEYYLGRKDFINGTRWPDTMANIVMVADAFLQRQSGLFRELQLIRQTVDELNVRAMDKELNEAAVKCLTIGLNLKDIFDFYHEMDYLVKECPYNSACPYPFTGFKSPTIIVCKNTVHECKHLESTRTAVSLVRRIGELEAGQYRRCSLLTPKLMAFYDRHYDEIKETTLEEKTTPKE